MSKIIIAGSRGLQQESTNDAVNKGLNTLNLQLTEVVSGGARGPDSHGELIAKVNNLPCTRFIPNWDSQGKGAGFIRNKEMADYADALIAVWDGVSKGTAHMIETMKKLNKPVFVYKV